MIGQMKRMFIAALIKGPFATVAAICVYCACRYGEYSPAGCAAFVTAALLINNAMDETERGR